MEDHPTPPAKKPKTSDTEMTEQRVESKLSTIEQKLLRTEDEICRLDKKVEESSGDEKKMYMEDRRQLRQEKLLLIEKEKQLRQEKLLLMKKEQPSTGPIGYEIPSVTNFMKALLKANIEQNVMFFGVSPPWFNMECKSLYIRKAYKDIEKLLKILSEEKQPNTIILGTPGVEKSFFAVYMLCKALQAGKTVIFHSAPRNTIYIFDPNESQVPVYKQCPLTVLEPNTLYMYDAGTKHQPALFWYWHSSRLIVFSSPDNCAQFEKESMLAYNMPTWSLSELYEVRKLSEYQCLSEDQIKDRWQKFGSVAQYVLRIDDALHRNDLKKLDGQIQQCDMNTIHSLTADMIFHRFVEEDKYESYEVMFASKYVENKVFQAINMKQRQDLMMFLQTSKDNSLLSGVRGQLHELIAAGGTFS